MAAAGNRDHLPLAPKPLQVLKDKSLTDTEAECCKGFRASRQIAKTGSIFSGMSVSGPLGEWT